MTRRTNNLKIVNEDILLVNKEDADRRDLNTGDIEGYILQEVKFHLWLK